MIEVAAARAIHFAATLSTAGAVFFLAFVGEPALRHARDGGPFCALVRLRLRWIAWIGVALVLASGAVWLLIEAEQLSDLPLSAVFSSGAVWSVLADTDFGNDWIARFVLLVLFAGLLCASDFSTRGPSAWKSVTAIAVAACLVGSLAFAGHAAATTGSVGLVHLSADILHLVAAAAWTGALVPLAILLGAARRNAESAAIAHEAAVRFSALGMASVGTLAVTGIINSWFLVGSVAALFGTPYGRLLLAKVALFAIMLAFAAVNRLRLTPRLGQAGNAAVAAEALRRLRRNSLAEAALGGIIIAIVGVLGTLPPAIDR